MTKLLSLGLVVRPAGRIFWWEGVKKMEMDFKQLGQAIKLIAEEKNLPEEQVQDVVQQALAAAYRRDYGDREQEVRVTMNLNTG